MRLPLPYNATLSLDQPVIVGILNVTPDSFSDGGAYADPGLAADHGCRMVSEGAGVIDIGGESTRPGAPRVDAAEQTRRVLPVIERLHREVKVPLSVDTTRAEVAQTALDAGASILNDVSAGCDDPRMLRLAAERSAPIVLMHMRGRPATMQDAPAYNDVVAEVLDFLLARASQARRIGVPPDRIILDPGIGFGKTVEHNLALMANLNRFVATAHPVMLGASRKSFLGKISGTDNPQDRDAATAATTALAVAAGVRLIRVHNVGMNRHAADAAWAVIRGGF